MRPLWPAARESVYIPERQKFGDAAYSVSRFLANSQLKHQPAFDEAATDCETVNAFSYTASVTTA